MEYKIRPMEESEYASLKDFLYNAIFIKNEADKPGREIIFLPELQIYIENFGKNKGDFCLCAEMNGKIIGAAWSRLIKGFAYLGKNIPETAISVSEEYRGMGIGSALMEKMTALLKSNGFKSTSLSVQKGNYAFKWYLDMGYKIVLEKEDELIMERLL
ncbi:MAG: GNAT family N-acetyltransferase [Clostridiales bacterium]|nr:GNAT family N-acetyltransferase [Clostridiales bacterium]